MSVLTINRSQAADVFVKAANKAQDAAQSVADSIDIPDTKQLQTMASDLTTKAGDLVPTAQQVQDFVDQGLSNEATQAAADLANQASQIGQTAVNIGNTAMDVAETVQNLNVEDLADKALNQATDMAMKAATDLANQAADAAMDAAGDVVNDALGSVSGPAADLVDAAQDFIAAGGTPEAVAELLAGAESLKAATDALTAGVASLTDSVGVLGDIASDVLGMADDILAGASAEDILQAASEVGGGPSASGVNVYPGMGCPGLSTCDEAQHLVEATKVEETYVTSVMKMSESLTTETLKQTQILGGFTDANQAIANKLSNNKLKAVALKHYQPGEQMCRIGSFMRTVAESDYYSRQAVYNLNQVFMTRYRNEAGISGATGPAADIAARVKQFGKVYCDTRDNANGLSAICNSSLLASSDPSRINKDISYPRTFALPLTLALGESAGGQPSADLENVVALGKHLYAFDVFQNPQGQLETKYNKILNMRSVMSALNVAHNSYVEIAGQKAAVPSAGADNSGPAHMKAMLREFGFETDDDITKLLGRNPSYYAQMEVLTKKMLQHPNFYTSLYDKPTNVNRVNVAMQAIQLIQARDNYESLLRREMSLAVLVEHGLLKHFERVNAETSRLLGD